jgi:hypothetical protein
MKGLTTSMKGSGVSKEISSSRAGALSFCNTYTASPQGQSFWREVGLSCATSVSATIT